MLPAHLKRYVVEQDYSRYTPVDQAVWRYIMRQLKAFLSRHAHPCYVDGLEKTGIELDQIPNIEAMSEKLQKFGWQAVPVSGFIPPAAFMELQSLSYLPIASDMRTIDHLTYTPAPDIVHEAAGHAPILVDPEFAGYLKAYAQVARKAIISREDMEQYEAIRVLSDTKEDPDSTPAQIQAAEKKLEEVTTAISHVSEAALLGRMNWWTAEYGLIGSLSEPRIFGAGLLSSVGEAKACLDPKIKKIPLTIDCINYAYDITEPQPQLFVTPDFSRLTDVLEELANMMAYRRGGTAGLEKARISQTPNTVELNSGLQISGKLKEYLTASGEPAYLQFEGPTQLCALGKQIEGQGIDHHAHGFGSPVGVPEGATKCLSEMSDEELSRLGLRKGERVELRFGTGAHVSGTVTGLERLPGGKLGIVSFRDCKVTREGRTLFDPSWGAFDMAVGSKVVSVFGGPADRAQFGETDDFAAKMIPRKQWPESALRVHRLYQAVRDLRLEILAGEAQNQNLSAQLGRFDDLHAEIQRGCPGDWLLHLDLYEIAERLSSPSRQDLLRQELRMISVKDSEIKARIEEGLTVMTGAMALTALA
jgi:phenylalanine-4-hydroxylase